MANKARYVCVPTRHGLFNVVDTASGSPAEVDATTVLLTRKEARRLIAWLNGRGASARVGPQAIGPDRPKADREYEGERNGKSKLQSGCRGTLKIKMCRLI